MIYRKRPVSVGFFQCEICEWQWYDFNVRRDDEQLCNSNTCNALVTPFTVQNKCYGHFTCHSCNYSWTSNHAFAEIQEKCRCGQKVDHHTLEPYETDGGEFAYYPLNTERRGGPQPHHTAFFRCTQCPPGNRNRNRWNNWYDYDLGTEDDINTIRQDCLECWTMVQPYAVEDRCFGNFYCADCRREWYSAYAYVNEYQKCKTCAEYTYPRQLKPLRRGGKKGDKNHEGSLCQRCINHIPH